MDLFPVSPGPFLAGMTADESAFDGFNLDLGLENCNGYSQHPFSEKLKDDGLFGWGEDGNAGTGSLLDELDSLIQDCSVGVCSDVISSPLISDLHQPRDALSPAPTSENSDDCLSTGDSAVETETEGSVDSGSCPSISIKVEPPSSTLETANPAANPSPPRVVVRTAVPAPCSPVEDPAVTRRSTITLLRPGRRSVLIPVSIRGSGTVKTVKILSTASVKTAPSPTLQQDSDCGDSTPIVVSDRTYSEGDHRTPVKPVTAADTLQLSAEERRLYKKEGVPLPTHFPLTRDEERELKRIRRKIRNKLSAQDSRKRKKEYTDGLEDRVRVCTTENQNLHKRVKYLETQNSELTARNNSLTTQNESLLSQLRRLQAHVTRTAMGSGRGGVQPSTCLMVLLLSLSLCILPNVLDDTALTNPQSASQHSQIDSRNVRTLLSESSSKPDLFSVLLSGKPLMRALKGLESDWTEHKQLQPAPAGDSPAAVPVNPTASIPANATRPPSSLVIQGEPPTPGQRPSLTRRL